MSEDYRIIYVPEVLYFVDVTYFKITCPYKISLRKANSYFKPLVLPYGYSIAVNPFFCLNTNNLEQ